MKFFFCSILCLYICINSVNQAVAQQINLQRLEVLEYCVFTDIQVAYKLNGTFNPDNKFSLEISDSTGIFTYHNVIGSINSFKSDTIKGKISSYLPYSSKYKLRIVSTSPAIISEPSIDNILIKDVPDYYRNIYLENEITAKWVSLPCDTLNSFFEFNCYNFKGKPSKVKWNSSKNNPISIKEETDTGSRMLVNLGSSYNRDSYSDIIGISFSNECGFSSSAALEIHKTDFRPNFDTSNFVNQKIDTACEGVANVLEKSGSGSGYLIVAYYVNLITNTSVYRKYYSYTEGFDTITTEYASPITLWKLPEGMEITKTYYRNKSKIEFSASKSGIIEIDLKNECGFTARRPLKIEMRVIPKPNTIERIIGDTLLCSNINNHFYSVKLDTLVSKYDWKINYPNQIVSRLLNGSKVGLKPVRGGTISVTGENECGVTNSISTVFKVDSLPLPPITVPQYSEICSGNIDKPININAISVDAGISKIKYRWELPSVATLVNNNSDGSTIAIKLLESTNSAAMKVFSQNYCGESKNPYTYNIKVYRTSQKPKVLLSSSNISICPAQDISFLANVSNAIGDEVFDWKLNDVSVDSIKDSTFSTSNIVSNTVVKVVVNSKLSCDLQSNFTNITFSDSIMISTKPLPIRPTTIIGNSNICLKDTFSLYEVTNNINQSYVWQVPNVARGISDSSKILLTPTKIGDDLLRIYSKNECGESLPISIDIRINSCQNLYIPNIFSCSSEFGWNIEGIDNYPKATVKVYNRWGSLVYENLGYKLPWNGSINGFSAAFGTYYYIIEFNYSKIEPITGSVTVVK